MNKRTKEATNEMTKEKGRKDGNREVVSDVFSMLMQYPEYALDIYNALNGSHYEDPRLVEIVTLKNGISLTVRNDGSFFIGGVVNFYEHQSTHNPNMPLRFTIYYLEYLKQWIKDHDVDLFGKKKIILPTPHFIVFYNGVQGRPDFEVMRLSASFDPMDSESEEAIDRAIDECIEGNILREFFIERRNEVKKVMELDFTWERREELIRREEFSEGKAEGKAEDILEMLEDIGEVPQELQDEIYAERNLEVLSKMLKVAAKAKSIADFQAKLEEVKCRV